MASPSFWRLVYSIFEWRENSQEEKKACEEGGADAHWWYLTLPGNLRLSLITHHTCILSISSPLPFASLSSFIRLSQSLPCLPNRVQNESLLHFFLLQF